MEPQRLAYLASKYFWSELSDEENRELDMYLAQASEAEMKAFYEMIDEDNTLEGLREMYNAIPGMKEDKKKIIIPGKVPGTGRLIAFNRNRYLSIAAIFLLVVTGFFVWRFIKPVSEGDKQIVETNGIDKIRPGGNKAYLQLSSGKTVLLDSMAIGAVNNYEGATITKDAEGRIVYAVAKNGNPLTLNKLVTPKGGQFQVVLPDGTNIWLNSASSVSYPTAFVEAERRVKITGQAYLEVAKDRAHPFIVETEDGSSVKVLGTHFDVMAYADEGSTNVTLVEGSVQVSKGNNNVLIKPGEQAQVENKNIRVNHNADIESILAWKNGKFSFDNADIETIMRTIGRWYDVDIKFEGIKTQHKIEGKITRDSDINNVLEILHEAGYNFQIKGKTIIVLP